MDTNTIKPVCLYVSLYYGMGLKKIYSYEPYIFEETST